MLKQEFEERYGKSVSEEMFENINSLYMESALDKDDFVADYKDHEESRIMNDLFERVKYLENQRRENKASIKELVDTIIKKGSEYQDENMLLMAENKIGKKETIKRKIAMHIELEEDDLNYINEHLA